MDTSAVVAVVATGALLLALCVYFACFSSGVDTAKRKTASTRIAKCFNVCTCLCCLDLFSRAATVVDPCGLSSKRVSGRERAKVVPTDIPWVWQGLAKLYNTSGKTNALPALNFQK